MDLPEDFCPPDINALRDLVEVGHAPGVDANRRRQLGGALTRLAATAAFAAKQAKGTPDRVQAEYDALNALIWAAEDAVKVRDALREQIVARHRAEAAANPKPRPRWDSDAWQDLLETHGFSC
jgi:hypothetical protein